MKIRKTATAKAKNNAAKVAIKIFIQLAAISVAIVALNILLSETVFAASLPITKDVYINGNVPVPPDKSGQEIAKDLVYGALKYAKMIIGVMGIVYITIMGGQLVMMGGNEDQATTLKKGFVYAIISFVIVSMSQDIAKIFDMESSTILQSPQVLLERIRLFDKEVEIVVTFMKYILGAFATLMVVRSAIGLIVTGGKEEEATKHKQGIIYSGAGLLLIYIGQIFIDKVFYKVDKQVYSGITGVHPGVDAKEGVEQIVGITNLIVTFMAPVALILLIAGAVMYATAGGEQDRLDKAKRLVFATIIGIVIIYGAFALVNTVIYSRLTEIGVFNE